MIFRKAVSVFFQFFWNCWALGIHYALYQFIARLHDRSTFWRKTVRGVKSCLEAHNPTSIAALMRRHSACGPSAIEFHPLWHLDKPSPNSVERAPDRFEIKGWIAAVGAVENIRFSDPALNQEIRLSRTRRPDVEASLKLTSVGFEGVGRSYPTKHPVSLLFENRGNEYAIFIPARLSPISDDEKRRKKRRLIAPHLQCPNCQAELPDNPSLQSCSAFDAGTSPAQPFTCPQCKAIFLYTGRYINFLSDELARRYHIVSTDNISANEYDGLARNFINLYQDGLILDCGAGKRSVVYENVINYDIVDYDSTDIVGVAETLPFRSAVFDAVFSFAVLEHVYDPFTAAAEMIRVLKPGGIIYCQAPFLSPRHGYPNHYFNMTKEGLERVFQNSISIKRLEVLNLGQPIHCLSWFLNSYMAGLPPSIRESFGTLRVEELLKSGNDYLGSPIVTTLSKEQQETLSCCNMLIGQKPS